MKIEESFIKLLKYCEDADYKGWDPYDGLNSKFFRALPLVSKNRFFRLAWIQFFKRSAINFRKITGVEKGVNPKGVALFISGYSALYNHTDRYRTASTHLKIEALANRLIDLISPGYSGACWGYNFSWQARAFFQPEFTPTVVATTFAANALIDAYEITGNKKFLETAITAKDFVLKDLNRTYDSNGNFVFSYSPQDKTSVFNASLLGARLLSRIYSYTKDETLSSLAKSTVIYCCGFQNKDGSWAYSPLPFHHWIDNFHTGFNLECIFDYMRFTGDTSFQNNFDNGMKYYLETFFDEEGRSKYYNNSLYPIDIHAPSQLIVTLSKAKLFDENRELIDRVTGWTVTNMQSAKGYFYYQKHKSYTNRIPYMRWSQGWIFYGLSHYLANTVGAEKSYRLKEPKSMILNNDNKSV